MMMVLPLGLALHAAAIQTAAAELQPRTAAAFDRYARATEAALDASARPFLRVEELPDAPRRAALDAIRRGELFIERGASRDQGQSIDVPDGLIHHWVGTIFLPGVALDRAVSLLQDYDHHAEVYKPTVVRSRILSQNGNDFRVHLRFYMKKVIGVTVNTDNEARFTHVGADRVESRIRSVRVAEVEEAGTTREKEKPVGNDGGFLWRLNTYWRFLARDGGTYLQCEAITLTRGIPFALGWLIGPFVTSIPRESLTFTLETTKKALQAGAR
jgi:hypothetical protein